MNQKSDKESVQMKSRGVTLLELMITVTVVAVLAAVAYPISMSHIRHTRRAEAIEHLLSAQLRQEEFRVTSGAYSSSMADLGGASTDLYTYSVTVSGNTYTLNAIAATGKSQSSDSGCTSFTLSSDGTRTPTACWQQ